MGFGKSIRAERLRGARTQLIGDDPWKTSAGADREAQRAKVLEFVRAVIDSGFDRLVVIEMFTIGIAWMADNLGASRAAVLEDVNECIREVSLKPERSFSFQPTGE